MSLISVYKVVSSVPSSLEANALYLVRTGTGFDFHVSDSTASVAYQINSSGGGGGEVVDDATPQLGGDLDLNGNDITGTGNISITGEIEADIHIGSLRGEIQFKAKAGEALTKGDPVYISSYDTAGNTPIVAIADANDSSKMPCFGLANNSASLNASVNIVTFGTLSGLDTSGFSLGDTLYISDAGSLTNSKPSGESSLIQNIGKVQRVDNSAGSVKVGGAGRTNDVPNLNQGNVFIGNASNQAETRGLSLDDIAETATNKHFTASDKTKLNGIETDATADQTDSEIKTAYESNADTNAFTDAEKTKLSGIESGATEDQSSIEIKTAYESNADTNAFTNAEKTKLSGIESGAGVNVNADWDASSGDAQILNKPTTITSAEQSKLSNITLNQAIDLDTVLFNVAINNLKITNADHTGDVTGSTALTIANGAVDNSKMANVATGVVKGRVSSGTGDVEDITIASLKTAINVTKGDVGLSSVQNINVKNGWSQNSAKYIASSEIRARDGNGLKLYNDAANSGLLVTDSGQVQASNGILMTGDWFRVNGNNGIYWQNYGGGWFMQDTTYIRAYNNKVIYTSNDIRGNRFVDNNNTNRYIDASSQSQLEGVTLANVQIRRVGFRNGDHPMLTYTQYAYNNSANYNTVHGRLDIHVAQGWNNDSNVMRFDNQGYGNKTAYIYGNLSVTGSVSKGSGSFDIEHPDPAKKDTHRLRHYFVETPSAGGNIYKYQLNCAEGDNYIDLPDYFEHLNQDSLVWVNPFKHFGRAWGEVIEGGRRAKIVVEKSGLYNVLIFGDRKDDISLQDFDKYGVEYKVDKNQKNIGVTLKK